jgi:hypothetical protein
MGVVISKGDLPLSKAVAGVPSRIDNGDDDDRLLSFSVEVDDKKREVRVFSRKRYVDLREEVNDDSDDDQEEIEKPTATLEKLLGPNGTVRISDNNNLLTVHRCLFIEKDEDQDDEFKFLILVGWLVD